MGRGKPAAPHRKGRAALLTALLLLPCAARAGVAEFLSTCVAHASDLRHLPAALAALGWVEVPPEDGPPGPALAQAAPSTAQAGRRLWTRAVPGGEAFTGLTPAGPGRPAAVCWHVSRPGETAAAAIAALKRRHPPLTGTLATGVEFSYGGFERWGAALGSLTVILGVSWAMRASPDQGTGYLYLVQPVGPLASP